MKKSIFLLLISTLSVVAYSQNTATIKGNVKNISSDDMRVSVYVRGTNRVDTIASTTVADDHTYVIEVPYKDEMEATVDCGGWQTVQVWLCDEPLTIDFRGGAPDEVRRNEAIYVEQHGGANAEVMNMINFELYRNFSTQMENAIAVWNSNIDTDAKRNISLALNKSVEEESNRMYRFIANHYSTRNSVMAALNRLVGEEDFVFKDSIMSVLASSSPQGKSLIDSYISRVEWLKKRQEMVKNGSEATDFTFKDEKGKERRLTDFIGKKILVVDFWASWCSPCRKEIPSMKRYYDEFRDKGVEFVSISLDDNREAWLRAVDEEKMPWPQMVTPDAGTEVMQLYQFSSIPKIMVITRDGRIFRNSVRGYGVKLAIEEALNK